jgi:transcriptional regulator with XRE-family HTH domain
LTIQTTIGIRIEQARGQAGLSLSQLARRMAVKPKTLENWESARSEPRGHKLVMLAGVLQVPLIWLLTGDTPQTWGRVPPVSETAEIAQKLERALVMQRDLTALLGEVSADVAQLQLRLDEDEEMVA